MKFENLSFFKKLWLMSFFLIATIAIENVVVYISRQTLTNQIKTMNEVLLPTQRNVMLADMQHDALRATIFRSIVAVERSDTEELESSVADQKKYSDKLMSAINALEAISLSTEIKEDIESLKPDISKYIEESKNITLLVMQGKSAEAIKKIPDFQTLFKLLEQKLGSLSDKINKEINDRNNTAQESANRKEVISTIIILFGLIIGILYSRFMINSLEKSFSSIINGFETETKKLVDTSTHLKKTSHHLADSASKQAASIEETVASVEEISSMMSQTTQGTFRCKELTQQGAENSHSGKNAISGLMISMTDFEQSNSQLEKMVSLISEISKKTEIINEIVFESRLLAFNASIEAARAGVYGKGFSVVAEEVGKLAVMSGRASNEISVLLESSRIEVSRIVGETRDRIMVAKNASENCNVSFLKMEESFTAIEESVNSIAKATREQEIGIKQTNISMNTMDKSTQNNSKNAKNVQSEVQALNNAVKAIDLANRSFKEIFYGKRADLDAEIELENSDPQKEALLQNTNHASMNADSLQSRHRLQDSTERTRPPEQIDGTDAANETSEQVAAKTTDSRWKKAS